MDTPVKDLIDAVHDIKRTIELDGGTFIAGNQSIWITQEQWDSVLIDPYLLTLPENEISALVDGHKILGVLVVVRT